MSRPSSTFGLMLAGPPRQRPPSAEAQEDPPHSAGSTMAESPFTVTVSVSARPLPGATHRISISKWSQSHPTVPPRARATARLLPGVTTLAGIRRSSGKSLCSRSSLSGAPWPPSSASLLPSSAAPPYEVARKSLATSFARAVLEIASTEVSFQDWFFFSHTVRHPLAVRRPRGSSRSTPLSSFSLAVLLPHWRSPWLPSILLGTSLCRACRCAGSTHIAAMLPDSGMPVPNRRDLR